MLFLAKFFCWLLPHSIFGNILIDLHVDVQTSELIWPNESKSTLNRYSSRKWSLVTLLSLEGNWFVFQHYASRAAHQPVCELLLDRGACANSQTHGGATALHRAAYCGHINIIKLLLKHGADPGLTDDDGSTPLHKVKHYRCLWWGIIILV